MKTLKYFLFFSCIALCYGCDNFENTVKKVNAADYLSEVKNRLQVKWPDNHTINLVYHGHRVPSGYFETPHVNTLASYPHVVLKNLKELYPYAVINTIVTAIGG